MKAKQQRVEREFHVGTREGLAVVPTHSSAKMKAIKCATVLYVPPFSEGGSWPQAVIESEQAVVEKPCSRVHSAIRRDRGVELARVIADRGHECSRISRVELRDAAGRDDLRDCHRRDHPAAPRSELNATALVVHQALAMSPYDTTRPERPHRR